MIISDKRSCALVIGEQALSHCERHTGPIHLMLTDVLLPEMDGVEIARWARAMRPDLRVIYMSGFGGSLVDESGRLDEDFVMIEKPFSPATLLRAVRQSLDTEEQSPSD